jgi:hypothetical protein
MMRYSETDAGQLVLLRLIKICYYNLVFSLDGENEKYMQNFRD